ncbi:hypothetical protein BDV93DRAFT_564270 [Ceratobasidium sp. AG-I]|nr:hypothetical protein BDV93DRAFT_564270 [Ceratobasidium sp. AG-I]
MGGKAPRKQLATREAREQARELSRQFPTGGIPGPLSHPLRPQPLPSSQATPERPAGRSSPSDRDIQRGT